MERSKVIIGVAATRRDVFSKEDARRHKDIILEKLKAYDVTIVDIEDINEEGLLFDDSHIEPIVAKFKHANVDGLFFPHTNFGTEFLVAKVCKALDLPALIWGPRDDAPLPDGVRTRDTQCGLFATGKVMRRFGVPFTYIVNCTVDDKQFKDGFNNFIAVCAIVKAFRNLKVLQIAPRPASFWTVIVNEGELLERFGIEVQPVSLSEFARGAKRTREEAGPEYQKALEQLSRIDLTVFEGNDGLENTAALKAYMLELCAKYNCTAVCIQCWTALQDELGIMPCLANGMLTDEGIPAVCETDIHGAISAIMLQESLLRSSSIFFADLTVRHPENDNAELLWHCGNFPLSLAGDPANAKAAGHFVFPTHDPGTGNWELKKGDITICRFDGDNGEYSLFIGEGKAVDGPFTLGTYVWFEVPDWDRWEYQLVKGPYVHHCAGAYGKGALALYEACRYIPGLKADPADPTKDELENMLVKGRG